MTTVAHSLPLLCRSFSTTVLSRRSTGRASLRALSSGPVEAKKRNEDTSGSSPKVGDDDTWRRASLADLEKEFGIKPKEAKVNQARSEDSLQPPKSLSREEWQEINKKWEDLERDALGMDPAKDNKVAQTLRQWGEWLVEKTKETDDADPRYVAAGLFVAFSVWFFLLLVTARAIEIPFQLPFLEY